MSKYWKKLDLDIEPILRVFKDEGFGLSIATQDHNYIEEFIGYEVETARLFWLQPHQHVPIHIDTIRETGEVRHWAVNIPIRNAHRGKNTWYDGHEIERADSRSCVFGTGTPIESTILDCPKLFRTDVYHDIDNRNNDLDRIVLSYRFKTNISWNQIVNELDL